MAEEEKAQTEAPPKGSRLGLLISLALALVAAGGGYWSVHSGLISPPAKIAGKIAGKAEAAKAGDDAGMPDVTFLPVAPLVISLEGGAGSRHLRFKAQLEVRRDAAGKVEKLMPRVVDVLNTYLRALELGDLTDSAALLRLRSQMLRRIQIVTGGAAVNDLLIMEFVLN